jgi:hypothetical protein
MSKVYLVSQGSYSDYSIVAAFSTEELANEYVRPYQGGYDPPRVEEMELDTPYAAAPAGCVAFNVRIAIPDGVINEVRHENYHGIECGVLVVDDWGHTSKGYTKTGTKALMVRCFARDEDHACKIASDKLKEYRVNPRAFER